MYFDRHTQANNVDPDQTASKRDISAVIFLPAHPESRTHIFALGLTF